MTLAKVQVREIGLKSVWISCGGETLGRRLIMDRKLTQTGPILQNREYGKDQPTWFLTIVLYPFSQLSQLNSHLTIVGSLANIKEQYRKLTSICKWRQLAILVILIITFFLLLMISTLKKNRWYFVLWPCGDLFRCHFLSKLIIILSRGEANLLAMHVPKLRWPWGELPSTHARHHTILSFTKWGQIW